MVTKEQQDRDWLRTTGEFRGRVKHMYHAFRKKDGHDYFEEPRKLLKSLFGDHNLTSNSEIDEMLMVSKNKVMHKFDIICKAINDNNNSSNTEYFLKGKLSMLKSLFGDNCFVNKKEFFKNDIVIYHPFKSNTFLCAQIIDIKKDEDKPYLLRLNAGENIWAYPIEVQTIEETFNSKPKTMQVSDIKDKIDGYFDSHIINDGITTIKNITDYSNTEIEKHMKLGDKVKVKKTGQIGYIGTPMANDEGYRVYGFEDGGWDGEYQEDELELLESFKFNIGDQVVANLHNKDHIGVIVYIDAHHEIGIDFKEFDEIIFFKSCSIKSYEEFLKLNNDSETKNNMLTEEDPDLAQKMPYLEHLSKTNRCEKCGANVQQCDDSTCQDYSLEEKELNLYELLKGCEGEKFFSISAGEVRFKTFYDYNDTHKVRTIRKDAIGNEHYVNFHSDGRRNKTGLPDLYPSEDLLKKYPLDAYSAWMEWKEARRPKRWRAEYGEIYYSLRNDFSVCDQYENNDFVNDEAWEKYNYFRTKEEAEQAAKIVKEALQKFHENNSEK